MLWGVFCTYPYIKTYGMDALRDAVIWGYGLFALIVASYLLRSGWLNNVPRWYRRLLPWFLIWAPLSLLSYRLLRVQLFVPGTSVPLVGLKTGDVAVHLVGIAAFFGLKCTMQL